MLILANKSLVIDDPRHRTPHFQHVARNVITTSPDSPGASSQCEIDTAMSSLPPSAAIQLYANPSTSTAPATYAPQMAVPSRPLLRSSPWPVLVPLRSSETSLASTILHSDGLV